MGHNFLSESPGFVRALGTVYSEGIATAVSIADLAYILGDERSYPIETSQGSLFSIYMASTGQNLDGRQNWLDGGANFSNLNPDIVDGIWLYHAEPNVSHLPVGSFCPCNPRILKPSQRTL